MILNEKELKWAISVARKGCDHLAVQLALDGSTLLLADIIGGDKEIKKQLLIAYKNMQGWQNTESEKVKEVFKKYITPTRVLVREKLNEIQKSIIKRQK
jgi:hypothetical protein